MFLLFLDTLRQVYEKQGVHMHDMSADESKHDHRSFETRMFEQSGKFRAERNLYLAGLQPAMLLNVTD